MNITTRTENTTAILTIEGRMDAGTAPDLEKAIQSSIAAGSRHLLLDMAALEYMSSAGLRCILSGAKAAMAKGGGLSVCSLNSMVREVMTLSGFDSFLKIYDSVDQALKQ